MKRIDAVIRRDLFGKVKTALAAASCPGMMVFTFRGHGRQGGLVESYRGRRFKVDLLPKVLITVFVNDAEVRKMVGVIAKAAKTGKIGDGKIFIAPVENALRIRTGEEGAAAI
jgi:nitrogen regulatory protein P-II 1